MTPTTMNQINDSISARLPQNWKFSLLLDEDEILLIFESPKTSIRIISQSPKNFDADPIEALEKIILKYLNGRFYK